jgi:predicted PurR-regulated permease PerM
VNVLAGTRRRAFVSGALLVVTLAGLVVALQAYQALWTVFAVVVTALLVALAVEPAVAGLARRGVPRSGAVAVVTAGLLLPLLAAGFFLLPPAVAQMTTFLRGVVETCPGPLARYLVEQQSSVVVGGALAVGTSVWSMLSALVLVPVLAVYASASMPALRRTTGRFVGDEVSAALGRFVAGRFLLALVNATVLGVVVAAVGGATPTALAGVVFLVSFLPVLGVLLTASAVLLVCLSAGWVGVGLALGVVAALAVVERRFWSPRWSPELLAVPTVLLALAMAAGGLLAGAVGAFLAAPVLLTVRVARSSRCP